MLDEKLATEQYAVGFKLGNTELRDKVQNALAKVTAEGTAEKVSEKWFGLNMALDIKER